MNQKRTVLIVEDNELNREILAFILEDSYKLLMAQNGAEGMEIVRRERANISLILLDIQMPIMDGYQFLTVIREDAMCDDIPIIVTTASKDNNAEIRCLEMGATDFVTKPYNSQVVLRRVESMIRLRETAGMLHRVERDPLTGAYTKNFFYEYVSRRIKTDAASFDMLCIEVESYRLLVDRYGANNCDKFVKSVVDTLTKLMPADAIIGKTDTAQLAIFMEHLPLSAHRAMIEKCIEGLGKLKLPNIPINCGVYSEVDKTLHVERMCYYSAIPIDKIRHHYGQNIAEYDEAIWHKVSREKIITDNMHTAIEEKQFLVYYQPKHDAERNSTGGAEALIRWIHPEMGFMNPGEFTSIFEHNGFIFELDKYMLDAVCADLRRWLDEGKPVVPISVNLSQTDFDHLDIADVLENIVDEHGVPHDLIHFEITESMDSTDIMQTLNSVNSLKSRGFSIELDDFGSGYSSLSTLGELPIDILKIDMSLIRNMFDRKHRDILEIVFLIAKHIGTKVVCEGVETLEQVEELKKMCPDSVRLYIQGYYYSKPLSAADFEKYIISAFDF